LNKKLLICVIALAAWSFFLWRGITVFKPGVPSLHYFNSDGAIPVLMSNEARPLTPFNLYYYGSDRWGGWPFLIAQAVSRVTGYRWSDISLSTFQIVWIFVGALAIAALSRKDYPVIGTVFLLTLCLHGETRYQIFWLSQVYGWQITAMLIAWYCLRRLIGHLSVSDHWQPRRWVAWMVLAFVFSYLSIWSSGTSVLFLVFVATVELFRLRLQTGSAALPARRWLKAAGPAFGAVIAAAVLERAQRGVFYSYALKHYGSDFSVSSHFRLDTGNLNHNLATQLGKLIYLAWWPLELLAVIALLVAFGIIVYAVVAKKGLLNRTFEPLLSDDTFWFVLGASGIALINFILTVLIAHVRINQYEDRYLTPTVILGPVSGLLVLYLILKLLTRRTRVAPLVMPIVAAAIVLFLIVKFPAPGFRHEYQTYNEIAAALEQKAPRAILLGDYWGTYVFTALQHRQPLTPVPIEGQENRMPWTRAMVRQASEVIVEYRRSKLAESGPPPAQLVQYGSTFRLVDPQVFQQSDFAFAKYVRENSLP
jgi:hypothetical protein